MSDLKLYFSHDCPYCHVVLKSLHKNNVTFMMIPVGDNRDELEKLSGQKSVPVLVDETSGNKIITETNEILSFISSKYGDGSVDKTGNSYGYEKVFNGTIDQAEEAITLALKEVGFGVLTYIDVKETLKKKIDHDRKPYRILGACNPTLAAEAILSEIDLGLLLPCNVVVYENDQNQIVVSAIKPGKMFSVVNRYDMLEMASEVSKLLKKAIDSI